MKITKTTSIVSVIILLMLFFLPKMHGQDIPARPAQATPRANFQNRQRIFSPEILPDNKVTFRLYAPKADSVKLVCDWMQGAESRINMAKNDSGLWSVTLGPL
jgi:1,4-alpha-glucan branching enzyme